MKQEEWRRWEPIQGSFQLAEKYWIDSITENENDKTFEIILTDTLDSHKVRIFFNHSIETYRNADEGLRLDLFDVLPEKYGMAGFGKWTFFKITNSSYIQ